MMPKTEDLKMECLEEPKFLACLRKLTHEPAIGVNTLDDDALL